MQLKHRLKIFVVIPALLLCSDLYSQIPLVPYRSGNLWGYADTGGRIRITPFTPEMPHPFDENGYALIPAKGGFFGLIDTTGKVLLPSNFREIWIEHPYFILGRYTKVEHRPGATFGNGDTALLYYPNGSRMFPFAIKIFYFHHDLSNRILIQRGDSLKLYEVNWKAHKTRFLKRYTNATFESFNTGASNSPGKVTGFSLRFKEKDGSFVTRKSDVNGNFLPDKKSKKTELNEEEQSNHVGIGGESWDMAPSMENNPSPNNIIITKRKDQYTLAKDPDDSASRYFDLIDLPEIRRGYYKCKLNGQWGILKKDGSVLIEPAYEDISPCIFISHNTAMMVGMGNFMYLQWIVKKNGKVGVLSENPDYNLPIEYDSIIPENYFHYLVKKNGLWGAVNDKGKEEIPCEVNLDYASLYTVPVLAMNRNIVLAGRSEGGYKLYSNQVLPNLETYDRVEANSSINNTFLTLTRNGLIGKAFEFREQYSVLPCRYYLIYVYNDLIFGNRKFLMVRLPDGREGYVREDGLEFFDQ